MGCDIHAFVELKDKFGNWHTYSQPKIDRNYSLFEKMAGVRGEVQDAIAPPRGLPSQCSLIVVALSDRPDWHSHSWLSLNEMIELEAWYKEERSRYVEYHWPLFGFLNGDDFNKENLFEPFVDARVVFWFDN